MVLEGMYRRPVINAQTVDNRRGRRWGPAYARQHLTANDNRHTIRTTTTYRPNQGFRSSPVTAASHQNTGALHQRQCGNQQPVETARTRPVVRFSELASTESNKAKPQFQALYEEFESMKRRGLVMNADPPPNRAESTVTKGHAVTSDVQGKRQRSPSEDFAEAMKIFMKSYLPTTTFTCAKPVDDWSKEAGNLLEELTDKEAHSDTDASVWSTLPSALRCDSRRTSSPWSTTPPKVDSTGFDIHRHIMEINPSPYPGGSPVSTDQSSSNHSSDNDADDEGAQSSSETDCEKTIGAKKSLKKRFHSSFTGSTVDSGYLSSATECDVARGKGVNARLTGTSTDSDEVSSDCGFTSSTCPSWPTSPLPSMWRSTDGQRLSEAPFTTAYQKPLLACPPVPPPLPPFMVGLSSIPIPPPPPPHLLQAHFQPTVSVAQAPARLSRLPPPPLPPVSGFALVGNVPPIPYVQQRPIIAPGTNNADSTDTLMGPGAYHKHKAWITDEILEMIAVRDRLYKRMKKHPAPDIVEMYKKVRNMVVGMTRNAKRCYEKQFEEQQMEQQLRKSRQVDNINFTNPFPMGIPQGYVPRTW